MLAALLLATLPQDPWTWDDFPVFVWRQRYYGKELPEELIGPFGGTNVVRDEEAEWVREKGYAFYVTSAAGRDELHLDADRDWTERVETWMRTRDSELLTRTPCLTHPDTLAKLERTLDGSLAARDGDHGFGLSLGDEVGLTPDDQPFDFCRTATCEARWRALAAQHGWPKYAPLTDEVRLALSEGDTSLVGPWLARRRMHREALGDLLVTLAERAGDAPVGLLGIRQAAAFGGLPWERLDQLAFHEAYPLVDARELTARWPSTAVGTVFLESGRPEDVAWQAWDHWLAEARGLVVWSDAYLEDQPASRARLAAVVRTIRALEEDAPPAAEPAQRVGLLHDDDSVAAAWLRDAMLDGPTWPNRRPSLQRRAGRLEPWVRASLRFLEDAHLSVEVLTLEEAVVRERLPAVLIAPNLHVIDPDELAALERYVDAGGTLVVCQQLGWVDSRGNPREESLLAHLRQRAPAQVLAPPSFGRFVRYPEQRFVDPGGGLEAFRAELEKRLGWEPPVRVTESSGLPVKLRSWISPAEGRARYAVLANLPLATDRGKHLRALELDVEVRRLEGLEHRIEWLYPRAGTKPLPGDAAVFEVVWTRAEDRDDAGD